ncbi:MAG TPA: hypothetical protein VMY87_00615 [Armatimonadota bacterium]|nr:hypothetical protein [Armatimonadota bacterium]
MASYEEFVCLSDRISRVNSALRVGIDNIPVVHQRSVHRIHDAALIIFHVFAFEDFCSHYVPDKSPGKPKNDEPRSAVLRNLRREAIQGNRLAEIKSTLTRVDHIIMLRNLCAHRLGRRKDLRDAERLTPALLREYGFETDGQEDDLDARWWPAQCVAFAACIPPLQCLAKWVSENLEPLSGGGN